jgi:hypothetical protein
MDAISADDLHLLAKGLAGGAAAGLVWVGARHKVTFFTTAAAGAAALWWASDAQDWIRGAVRHHRVGTHLLLGAAIASLATTLLVQWRQRQLVGWLPVAAGASAVAAWTSVPKTTAILPAAGVVLALALVSLIPSVRATALATAAMAAGIALGVLAGYAPTDLRRAGAIATLGLLLWWPIGQLARAAVEQLVDDLPGVEAGAWLIVPHGLLAVAAARWVGVAPDATRPRLMVLGAAGALVAAACRPSSARPASHDGPVMHRRPGPS